MIELHKLNGEKFVINAELIESVELRGDTLIHLTSGNTFVVEESTQEVMDKVMTYRQQLLSDKKKSF